MEKLDIHPRILLATRKARLTTFKSVICLSASDLKRATKLSSSDVEHLLKTVSNAVTRPPMETALNIYLGCGHSSYQIHRLSLGCPILDNFLHGGILSRGITEITGESAAGKTQLCIQLCLTVQLPGEIGGLGGGAVYISTEDVFPSKRLQQLIPHFLKKQKTIVARRLKPGDNIFIEHAVDLEDMKKIIMQRVPLLINRSGVKLVVVDSIAALFRVEFSVKETNHRAKALRSFGAQLHSLTSQYGISVVCVNQVSAVISNEKKRSRGSVVPALGLAWSSMTTTRLMLSRTDEILHSSHSGNGQEISEYQNDIEVASCSIIKRELKVMFAPHLSTDTCPFFVDAKGVHGLDNGLKKQNEAIYRKETSPLNIHPRK